MALYCNGNKVTPIICRSNAFHGTIRVYSDTGALITCNGQAKTLTSSYVDFYIYVAGTYTVTATYNGMTNSKSVSVSDLSIINQNIFFVATYKIYSYVGAIVTLGSTSQTIGNDLYTTFLTLDISNTFTVSYNGNTRNYTFSYGRGNTYAEFLNPYSLSSDYTEVDSVLFNNTTTKTAYTNVEAYINTGDLYTVGDTPIYKFKNYEYLNNENKGLGGGKVDNLSYNWTGAGRSSASYIANYFAREDLRFSPLITPSQAKEKTFTEIGEITSTKMNAYLYGLTYDYGHNIGSVSKSNSNYAMIDPIFLGCDNSTSYAFPAKIEFFYYLKYRGTSVAIHMIPAKRNSDDVYGMYDLVSGTFFTNNGTLGTSGITEGSGL